MRTLKYTFWQDGEFFLGYLNDYPDYQTPYKTVTANSTSTEINENLGKSVLRKLKREGK